MITFEKAYNPGKGHQNRPGKALQQIGKVLRQVGKVLQQPGLVLQ
jgi:hypothetical protein